MYSGDASAILGACIPPRCQNEEQEDVWWSQHAGVHVHGRHITDTEKAPNYLARAEGEA